jgi:hypothetical protein
MKKKRAKVEEPAAQYGVDAPKTQGDVGSRAVRYVDTKTAARMTKKIFDKHAPLFRKLAQ